MTGEKEVKPVTSKKIVIQLDDEKQSTEEIEFDEDSAIFAFGDEGKPADAGAPFWIFSNRQWKKNRLQVVRRLTSSCPSLISF